jgi:chloramphenicol O-acetyltransferase
MPVSIEVHHALLDGIHVARFLEYFQNALREAEL